MGLRLEVIDFFDPTGRTLVQRVPLGRHDAQSRIRNQVACIPPAFHESSGLITGRPSALASVTMMKKGSGVPISKLADPAASDHHTAPPAIFFWSAVARHRFGILEFFRPPATDVCEGRGGPAWRDTKR